MSGSPSEPQPTTPAAPQRHGQRADDADSDSSRDREPPPPPNPSSDPRLGVVDQPANPPAPVQPQDDHDLFKLAPAEALRLLSAGIELLVRLTGDIPPTPPIKMTDPPQMSGMQAEKDSIRRSHSDLEELAARHREAEKQRTEKEVVEEQAQQTATQGARTTETNRLQAYSAAVAAQLRTQQRAMHTPPPSASPGEEVDGVQLKSQRRPSAASPYTTTGTDAATSQPGPYIVIGDDSQPINLQHGAITRKFYSKKEPPIALTQYLLRLHQFCPMSTAVYLATSLYIHRLAVEERAIPVTRRNAHRLVLAGLRVAMKALEDLSYPHCKMARVGGVSEAELARLEISFCFLTGFQLVVREESLRGHWEALRKGKAEQVLRGLGTLTLKMGRRPRERAAREVPA